MPKAIIFTPDNTKKNSAEARYAKPERQYHHWVFSAVLYSWSTKLERISK